MDEKAIRTALKEFGSPLYILDEMAFIQNYRNLETAFRNIYPKYQIAYSFKTNYTPYVCGLVKELGGYAEVVSDFEYYLAKKIGYDNSEIIYNGPYKQELVYEHLLAGGCVNLDNEQEAERILRFASGHGDHRFKLGLRVNIDVGQGFISRFGMDPDGDEFRRVLDKLKDSKNLKLTGIHCHVSQARGLKQWIYRIERIFEIIDRCFNGTALEYIDLGSGMFGDMDRELAEQFEGPVPGYSDYAEAVARRISERFENCPDDEKPVLITEPGTTLVARYFSLAATVQNIKTIRGKRFAGLDASFFNAGETCRYKKLPIRVFSSSAAEHLTDIAGYTCLEEDILYPGYRGAIESGDVVLLGNTGGYSLSLKPPFILPDCACVVLKEDQPPERIKVPQSYEDILKNYIFQGWEKG